MEREAFEELVAAGLMQLPERFLKQIRNVAIVISDRPTSGQRQRGRIDPQSLLLGLYEGVPKTSRFGQTPLLPDKITIFQDHIEAVAGRPEDIPGIVANTVWHEVGHYFGLTEAQIHRADHRRRRKY